VQLIDHLKKVEMAKEAERLLDGSGWLPEPLRTADAVAAEPTSTGAAPDAAEALPAFLADDQEENPEEEPDKPVAIAAE